MGRRSWRTRKFFRSLEMAYQGASAPLHNFSSIYDYGSHLGHWISAFEVLTHPRKGRVGWKDVLDLLAEPRVHDPRLQHKRYVIRERGHQASAPRRCNLPQRLYKQAYDARNDFLHGNPVRLTSLYPFRNRRRPPLTMFMPLLFRLALDTFLEGFPFPKRVCEQSQRWDLYQMYSRCSGLERALLRSLMNDDEWERYLEDERREVLAVGDEPPRWEES